MSMLMGEGQGKVMILVGGRGTGSQGCDRGHCGRGWDVSVIIIVGRVGIFVLVEVKGGNVNEGSNMREGRDVGRIACSGR
jgi:hypothetical protein